MTNGGWYYLWSRLASKMHTLSIQHAGDPALSIRYRSIFLRADRRSREAMRHRSTQ